MARGVACKTSRRLADGDGLVDAVRVTSLRSYGRLSRAGFRPRGRHERQHVAVAPYRRRHHPVNPDSPSGIRGRSLDTAVAARVDCYAIRRTAFDPPHQGQALPPATMLTRRAGCQATGSSGSTEALQSNPGVPE